MDGKPQMISRICDFEIPMACAPICRIHDFEIGGRMESSYSTCSWGFLPSMLSTRRLLMENLVQKLGATGAGEEKVHPFFKDIIWDMLARQKDNS